MRISALGVQRALVGLLGALWALAMVGAAAPLPDLARSPVTARNYRLSLQFRGTQVAAVAEVEVAVAATTEQIDFDLAPGLEPGDLAAGGQTYRPAPVSPGRYRVLLVAPWPAGSRQRIVLRYSGSLAAPDEISPRRIELLPGTAWYPRFSASSRFSVELRLAGLSGLHCAARGEFIGTDDHGWQTWRDRAKAADLGLIAAPMAERDFAAPGLTISAYAADPASLRSVAMRLIDAAATVERSLGPSPRHHRELNLVVAADLESALVTGNLAIVPVDTAPDPAVRVALLRGIADWWWGRPGMPGWLEAGLQTVSALRVLAAQEGEGARRAWLPRLQAAAREVGQGAGNHSDDELARAARAGLVLNALRLEIGDDNFARLLRAWAGVPPASPAAAQAEFERLASRLGGQDLTWFWRQWLGRPGLPRIDFEWRTVRLPRSGQTIRVSVRQPAPAYQFRAPILIVSGGRRYWQYIAVRNSDTILGIPVRGAVDSVQFDPDQELLRAAPPT
ncbi:MAG: hypothetical protein ACRD2H_10750 [Terriglobales bacterium]